MSPARPAAEEPAGAPIRHEVGACGKRRYHSAQQARRANGRAGFRVRAYWCDRCHGWHVTASEKRA